MSYSKINWENLPSENTPVNATNLNKMDTQIFNNSEDIITNASDINDLKTRMTTAEGNLSKLNLTDFESFNSSTILTSYGTISNESNIQVATNEDGTVGKIYGHIILTGTETSNDITVTIPGTKLRPEEALTINGVVIRNIYTAQGLNDVGMHSMSIATNGNVTITMPSNGIISRQDLNLIACLLFLTDFGDTPL